MVRGIFDRELWGAMGDGAVALPVCSLAHALPELLAISLNDFLFLRPPPNKVPCAVGPFVRAVHHLWEHACVSFVFLKPILFYF